MATATSAPERLGLFGGTFDPLHYGHLRAAEEVRQAFGLQAVCFLPAARPPHKTDARLAPADLRLEMVTAGIAGHPCFRVSDFELRKSGLSYSIDTIRHFRRTGAAVSFILGGDAFRDIASWKDFRELFSMADFIVMSRPDGDADDIDIIDNESFPVALGEDFCYAGGRSWRHAGGHRLDFFPVTRLAISSTLIRRERQAGRSITFLVPPVVERIVAREGLYLAR
ncbi:MAG: nicotinate (nicotinamide) nucleotide adenylyltransferase [Deltaproteobacteria bacterium]|nr:nicotinate (nicotinamide) nucleotide adenylyltransferase [Candidatus Anaeroferrophillacea bacterium]